MRLICTDWLSGPFTRKLRRGFPCPPQWVKWENEKLVIEPVPNDCELLQMTEKQNEAFGESVRAFIYFFSVLACSNVEKRLNQPSPERNARRARQGKLPLFDYWTLHIILDRPAADQKPYQGGTHASPRVHLRRGHIRRLESGKTVWVQSCVVGWRPDKPGGILKDYAVTHGIASQEPK